MEKVSIRFFILLVTCLLFFDREVILKVVAQIDDYYDEQATGEEVFTTTTIAYVMDTTTGIDDSYSSVLVDEPETTAQPNAKERADKPEPSTDDIIELNIGGQKITTFRSTLTAVPDSKLALLFTKTETKSTNKSKSVHFFDYNPVQFAYLLDQLRSIKRTPRTPAYELNFISPNADVRFNFSTMLFELGLNPDRFLSPLEGTHLNLTVNSLIGWKECFRGKYNTAFDGKVLTNTCKGNRLFVACRSISDRQILLVAGIGKREDILHPCTVNSYCSTQMKNGTGFYYVQNQAWGFEGRPKNSVSNHNTYNYGFHQGGSQESFLLNPCDSSDQHSEYRLCWSLRSNVGRGGGDRCGTAKNLHNTDGWERLIYQTI